MVKENADQNPSYWYSFDYVSQHKTAFHALFSNPELKANVTPGVCHGDELLYLFDAELPLAFCDVAKLSADASACMEDTGDALGDLNNAIACLTSPGGAFRLMVLGIFSYLIYSAGVNGQTALLVALLKKNCPFQGC